MKQNESKKKNQIQVLREENKSMKCPKCDKEMEYLGLEETIIWKHSEKRKTCAVKTLIIIEEEPKL